MIDIVVGTQWGDEGKGKIVDSLCDTHDVCVRFNGSENAGHSVVLDCGERIAFNQIPVGALYGLPSMLVDGVVVNIDKLIKEADLLKKRKIDWTLYISSRAHVKTLGHIERDIAEEAARGSNHLGTTKTGNAPAYADKASRKNLRIGEVSGSFSKNENIIIDDTSYLLNKWLATNSRVLFEGAHGIMLDIDHGTYPHVSSSGCTAGAACHSAGVSPKWINRVIGVTKVYTTRIGSGAMPTEIKDDKISSYIRDVGREYGTVSGRPRRIGWLDLPALKHAVRVGGVTEIALTRADVLDGFNTVYVGVEYRDGNKIWLDHIPDRWSDHNNVSVGYKAMKGWGFPSGSDTIPSSLMEFIHMIEDEIDLPVTILSSGAKASETLFLSKEDDVVK